MPAKITRTAPNKPVLVRTRPIVQVVRTKPDKARIFRSN